MVSAHYPPNFVSGGTLQPQRLARALRARGHEVSVYAGWLGPGRRPWEAWTDIDAGGVPVRWIVTTPWTGWDDRRNWNNPRVSADFGAHLARVRPDVVHAHSLQTLGAGVVAAAADAGARVVITMHDFWWFCARQFLVDPGMQPCCEVVDAGVCPCAEDWSWLEARNRALRALLLRADLVLAPSASAARVLAANGVDPGRLAVDENGLPEAELALLAAAKDRAEIARPQSRLTVPVRPGAGPAAGDQRREPLRLLYAGGSNELKGVGVLFDAARRLAGSPGWRLLAYGAEGWVREVRPSLDGLPIELRPPFEPGEANQVFAEADVLVVPSVARESYSLVTREALARGIPVVCTDSLGPEEVVEHGVNGLVVPTADPAALARTLGRLLEEPDLLPTLRAGCQSVALRPLADQVAGLERTYQTLLAGRPRSPRADGIQRVLFMAGIEGAPLRYRVRLPAEALALLGITCEVRHYRDPALSRLSRQADALVVYRVPATPQVLSLIQEVRRRRVPVFFDVDDLIFDPEIASEIPALTILDRDAAALWLEGVRRYRTTMEACDVYIGSTAMLCRHAAAVTGLPTERFDNGVSLVLARQADFALRRTRLPGPLRVGYFSGTTTHDHDWALIEPAVAEVLARRPEVELWLVGHVPPVPALARFGARVRRWPIQRWPDLPGWLRDVDVNLAPLAPDSRFNEAKSAIKWLEAALAATPTIASPTEPFREAVAHDRTGLLAARPEEWVAHLDRLLTDREARERLGRAARREALLRWSPHLQGRRYLEILERGQRQVVEGPPPARPAGRRAWTPVILDEPPEPFVLEPYPPPADRLEWLTAGGRRLVVRCRRRAAHWRRRAARAAGIWREQGVGAVARKAVEVVRRGWASRGGPRR